tara:strand:- start:321 stop:1295 length:975 start_codon:yes stop_codon:yes gene_type:complete
LAPHGSICVELGDTYSGSGGGGGDYLPGGLRDDQPGFGGSTERQREGNAAHWRAKNAQRDQWPLDKSLCMIPQLFAASLSYGRNLLEPTQQFEPWRVRNVVRWVRPNPPVGALGDKFRPATSEMTVACMSRTRWFDLDAVREPAERRASRDGSSVKIAPVGMTATYDYAKASNPAGAPPLDWWEIPTHPYPGSHYATWPPALCVKPIKAMCPLRVCTTCGEPSRRIVEHERTVDAAATPHGKSAGALHSGGPMTTKFEVTRTTLGWTDCGHDTWRAGVVLDPFGGSGTTGMVATGLGRDAILIDLDARNADLARDRIGMFMETA